MILTPEEREDLGHRIAWRYKKSSDPNHSDTYTFNADCLDQFAAAIERAVLRKLREAGPVAIADGYFNCNAPLGTPLFTIPEEQTCPEK